MINDLLQIGRIIGTHGIKGEVTIFPLTDDPRRFSILKACFLMKESDTSKVPAKALSARYSNNRVILRLEGVEDRDTALALKGRIILVDRKNAVKLPPDTYFICDLIGSRVIDDDTGMPLGILADILQTGSSDIYEVKRENQKNLLLPAIKEVIKEIDLASTTIRVHLIDGLLDL